MRSLRNSRKVWPETTVITPESCPSVTKRSKAGAIRSSRSLDMPALSGTARGRPATW